MPAPKYLPRYTITDYFGWEGDWELWRGVAVSMTPSPFGKHQRVARNLMMELSKSLDSVDCECEVIYELDWVVDQDTVVRPDVMVLRDGIPEGHVTTVPVLIAEVVSPSTERKDRTAKRELYESEGVAYYIIADPETSTLEILQRGNQGRYEVLNIVDSVATIELNRKCIIKLAINQIF